MISYDSLIPNMIEFGLEYSSSYLYLDNRGKILRDIFENLKEIGRVDISEDKTSILFPEKKLAFYFSPKSIAIEMVASKDVKMLGEWADLIVSTVCRFLEISVFSRIVNRFQFVKPIDSSDDFSKIFAKNKLINIPEAVVNKLGNNVKKQAVAFTIDKDESFVSS